MWAIMLRGVLRFLSANDDDDDVDVFDCQNATISAETKQNGAADGAFPACVELMNLNLTSSCSVQDARLVTGSYAGGCRACFEWLGCTQGPESPLGTVALLHCTTIVCNSTQWAALQSVKDQVKHGTGRELVAAPLPSQTFRSNHTNFGYTRANNCVYDCKQQYVREFCVVKSSV